MGGIVPPKLGFVPVQDATNKGADQGSTSISTCSSLNKHRTKDSKTSGSTLYTAKMQLRARNALSSLMLMQTLSCQLYCRKFVPMNCPQAIDTTLQASGESDSNSYTC
eukprot:GHRR01015609.1.p6 GENE.GHRR01015609.1~~GHRR01015609.1.p6  ORF type:complete len:108 (+),score=16.11 GHRR01015609.1:1886-2209(+)